MTQKAEELEMSFTQNKKIDCIEYVSLPVTNEAERIKTLPCRHMLENVTRLNNI